MTEHAHTTDQAPLKKLRRPRDGRMLWGVCSGLGDYFEVNPIFYRVGFVVLALLGGAGILMYVAAALVVPDEGRDESLLEDALREQRDRPWRLVGVGLLAAAAIALLSHAQLWPHGDVAWILVALAGIALIGSWRHRSDLGLSPAPLRRSFPVAAVVVGLLVTATAVLVILDREGVHVQASIALAGAAIFVGIVLILAALLRLRIGRLAVLGIVLGAAAILASTVSVHLNDGIGDRRYSPVTAASLRSDYRLGIGDLRLNLTGLKLRPGTTRVSAHIGIGELRVVVPAGVNVRVVSHVDWGDSRVLGREQNGHSVDQTVSSSAAETAPTLVVTANVGAGQVRVERAGT